MSKKSIRELAETNVDEIDEIKVAFESGDFILYRRTMGPVFKKVLDESIKYAWLLKIQDKGSEDVDLSGKD